MMATMLPKPTAGIVQNECEAFDQEPSIRLAEQALAQLRAQFPFNTEASKVLLKVIVLNQLYSTRINYVDLIPFARHIAGLGIDQAIEQGSLGAVELIWRCEGTREYYSFATKFCGWHNPKAYPLYDHYVDECLWAYKKQDQFFDFQRQQLYEYEELVKIVDAFRDHYGLNDFTFKQIDKFLWNTGERILSEKAAS